MRPEQKSEETILEEALSYAPKPARDAYLERACSGDAALRQRVETLLQAHQETGGFLQTAAERPPIDLLAGEATSPGTPLAEGPGTHIGRYKLLEQIGEGGFGVVFMAEQEEFVADVQRHLHNEPVLAKPPSTMYKLQKFVRHNKTTVTLSASIGLALIVVLVLGTISYQRERAARREAETAHQAEAAESKRAQAEAARAQARELDARQNAYAADMLLAQLAFADNSFGRVAELLHKYRPTGKVASEEAGKSRRARKSISRNARRKFELCTGLSIPILAYNFRAI